MLSQPRSKKLDNTLLPVGYILTAVPYMWLGILLAWLFCIVIRIFPLGGGYSFAMQTQSFLRLLLEPGATLVPAFRLLVYCAVRRLGYWYAQSDHL